MIESGNPDATQARLSPDAAGASSAGASGARFHADFQAPHLLTVLRVQLLHITGTKSVSGVRAGGSSASHEFKSAREVPCAPDHQDGTDSFGFIQSICLLGYYRHPSVCAEA